MNDKKFSIKTKKFTLLVVIFSIRQSSFIDKTVQLTFSKISKGDFDVVIDQGPKLFLKRYLRSSHQLSVRSLLRTES